MRLIGTVSLGAFVLVAYLAASHFDHAGCRDIDGCGNQTYDWCEPDDRS